MRPYRHVQWNEYTCIYIYTPTSRKYTVAFEYLLSLNMRDRYDSSANNESFFLFFFLRFSSSALRLKLLRAKILCRTCLRTRIIICVCFDWANVTAKGHVYKWWRSRFSPPCSGARNSVELKFILPVARIFFLTPSLISFPYWKLCFIT